MDNTLMPRDFRFLVPVAVDAQGREQVVDPRAFEPLPWVDLSTWIGRRDSIDDALAGAIGPYLLANIREARDRAATGRYPGTYRRRFGWLAAPNTQLSPERWGPDTVPEDVAALRVYQVRADLDGAPLPHAELPRRLVFQYPQRP